MKTETAVNRILNSDKSTALKILKLQTLALKTFASSPAQKYVIAHYKALQAGEVFSGSISDFYVTQ